MDYLASVSRNNVDDLRAVEYGTRFGDLTPLGQQETSRWFVASWVRFCPERFREDSYWRAGWEFGSTNVCAEHNCLLTWCCPKCSVVRRGVFDNRESKHFDPRTCHSCGFNFTATPTVAATAEQTATQKRIDALREAGAGWNRFEDAVRCLTACRADTDAGRYLSPFRLPVAPEVTLAVAGEALDALDTCLLYTSPSPRDLSTSRMPSSA